LLVAATASQALAARASGAAAAECSHDAASDAAALERLWVRTMRAAITAQHAVVLALPCF
jgi:hypothetical protein